MSRKLSTIAIITGILIAVFSLWFLFSAAGARLNPGLKAFWLVEMDDPLFDFPGLSQDEWHEALDIIKTANHEVLAQLPKHLGSFRIYPYDFWSKAAKVAEKRRIFLDEPTWIRAWRLLSQQSAALKAYSADLESFKQLWQASWQEALLQAGTSRSSPETIFMFLPGVVSDKSTIDAMLSMFETNTKALEEDLRSRRNCLLLWLCKSLIAAISAAENSHEETAKNNASLSPGLLPSEHLAASQEYLSAETLDNRLFAVKTDCFGQANGLDLFLLWQRKFQDSSPIFFPKLVTNSFFRVIQEQNLLPQDMRPKEAGFSYSWQPETNWYMCPDLSYYPMLATMQYLAAKSRQEPLAGKLAEAQNIEELLNRSAVVDSELLEQYIDVLQAAKTHQNLNVNSSLLDEPRRRINIWKTKSGNLIGVLRGLKRDVGTFVNNSRWSRDRGRSPQALASVASRAHFSLFYAPWNPSVWRLKNHSRFITADDQPRQYIKKYIKDYWTLRSELSEETIRIIQKLTLTISTPQY